MGTWSQLVAHAGARLGSPMEARWMAEEVAGADWPAGATAQVGDEQSALFERMLRRRETGEPLQYILGRWSFRGLELLVDRRVLVPRPETEVLVEVALGMLPATGALVVDLGTGSGAIALSVASERPAATVWATDLSAGALDVARANLASLGGGVADRVRLARGSWWSALPASLRGRIDLVVSNPPYVTSEEMAHLDPTVAEWEPRCALEAGPHGLEAVAEILAGVRSWVRPGGAVAIEIAPQQASRASGMAGEAGLGGVEVRPDLAGRERVLAGRLA